jgi:hypothetical protein
VFVPSWRIELRHWHELCHPYYRDINSGRRILRWDRLSFTVAFLRDLDSSEKSTEHESKNTTEQQITIPDAIYWIHDVRI